MYEMLFFSFNLVYHLACYRLQEKVSDMESENQILRQQSLLNSPVKRIPEHPSTLATQVKINEIALYIFLSIMLSIYTRVICRYWKMVTMWLKRRELV